MTEKIREYNQGEQDYNTIVNGIRQARENQEAFHIKTNGEEEIERLRQEIMRVQLDTQRTKEQLSKEIEKKMSQDEENERLKNAIIKEREYKTKLLKELRNTREMNINSRLPVLEEKQTAFLNSLDSELGKINLNIMSLGDLTRMEQIFFKHLQRVKNRQLVLSRKREEMIKDLENREQCSICLNGIRSIAFLPCRHQCSCVNCADKLLEDPLPKCPICREIIEDTLQVFTS